MTEVWLRQNTRAILFGMAVPASFTLVIAVWLSGQIAPSPEGGLRVLAWVLAGLGVFVLLVLLWQVFQPRLAYSNGKMFVNLRAGKPIAVPIDVVEAFLLGQAPAMLTNRRDDRTETRVLTVRLAERAEEWAMVEVKPALGKWCGGYITIRGTWCEPLSISLVNRLNLRLSEVKIDPGKHRAEVSG
jgi:hypothetical protein